MDTVAHKRIDGVIVEKYQWQYRTRLLAVYDGSDNLVQRFEYADSRMPLAVTQGGSTYYLAYDQVDSLRIVTDVSGNVIKRIDYGSFGNILSDTNESFTIPFGFAGGLHDRDIGRDPAILTHPDRMMAGTAHPILLFIRLL